jgi:HlyD family secretion protein
MSAKRILALAGGIALAAASLVACGRGKGGSLSTSGNIEATEVQLSFRVQGRMAERFVDEGDRVKAGQVVARLDSSDLKQQVALREADLQTALAALDELTNGYRKEDVAQAKASLDAAEAEAARLASDDERQTALLKKEVISQKEYDFSHAALLAAQAARRQASERYALMKKGPRPEQIQQARSRAEAARQALALAQTQLGYGTIASPLDGMVLSKEAEPGEVLAAGAPVVTVADLSSVYMRAYIDETDLGRVRLGQKAVVTTDTFPGKGYEGKVSFISSEAEFTPKSVQTKKERVKLVYRIKIDIPNPKMELKPGMPADAIISDDR